MDPAASRWPESGILLLGSVAVAAGGQVTGLPQLSLRVLLATLATTTGVVPVTTLIDTLWQEEHSQRRVRNLHTRVYELRRWLTGVMTESLAPRIVTEAPGYRLTVAPGHLDVAVFARLAGQARDALRAGDYASSAALGRQSLALWRGPALSDVGDAAPRLRELADQLEEQRLAVLSERITADLAGGRDAELLGELTGLVQRYPFRERLRYQLILSLYRCGRQADALAAYQDARRTLREELGLDPGPELTELHQRILMSDAGLAEPEAASPAGKSWLPSPLRAARPAPTWQLVPRQLPPALARFAGRGPELDELDSMLHEAEASPGPLIVAITGGPGVGKSALALRWAHEVSSQFPDGQLYVNLQGHSLQESGQSGPLAPEQVIRGLLEALGVQAQRVPASPEGQLGLYRSLTAGQRILIVMDNASEAEQVRSLLPGGAGCVVVVTSRSELIGLDAIDGAPLLPLDVFTVAEAHELLRGRRPGEYGDGELAVATELIELCARLPLALSIALARADARPGRPLASLVDELRDERGRLDALDAGEESASIRAAFTRSYQSLAEPAARMFRLLAGWQDPEVDLPTAASLAGMPVARARELVAELIAAHLLDETSPGRFCSSPLLRLYGKELGGAQAAAHTENCI